ncbi:kinase-like protein [Auricularia subglabra TFB-10046 SS5]|nr:kinase-like protein [Auricularia subglabra TFB-10046 SS5]
MPYADGGDLREYLFSHKNTDIHSMLRGIAAGVTYLHSSSAEKDYVVIHGNIHITKVLVHAGVPRLTGFELCEVLDARGEPYAKHQSSARKADEHAPFGYLTSLAPELVSGERRTAKGDVYAFGMLAYEAYAGNGPFPALQRLSAVVTMCERNLRPPQPTSMPDEIWVLTTGCWDPEPEQRPVMSSVYASLLPA